MTEKEFENLKVGDKVWYRRPSADHKTTEVVCREVRQKNARPIFGVQSVFVDCLQHDCHCDGVWKNWYEGSLTQSEEWQKEVEGYETRVKESKMDLVGYKKHLAHAKTELAKAKEEETAWVVDFDEGAVIASDKKTWDWHAEHGFPLGERRHWFYHTEREAYEALAKFYERKLFKALEKCGYKFAICYDKYIAVVKTDKDKDEFLWCYYYPERSYGSVRKTNIFDTLEEAEAELERRKND